MAKHSDIRQTEAWTQSKVQMISILNKKVQKINVDQHFKDVDVNDFHMGIHSLVRFRLLTFQKNNFLSIARMTERKYAMKLPSICVAYSFSSSSGWDWFSASYQQQKMNMKNWL